MYVEELKLTDFRAISHAHLAFTWPGDPRSVSLELPNINLLVGTNGGGKSTILKAIAAAVMADRLDLDDATGGSIAGWPRIGGTQPTTSTIEARTPPPADSPGGQSMAARFVAELVITREGELHPTPAPEPESFPSAKHLYAYGPFRRAGLPADESTATDPESQIAGLLTDTAHQIAPEGWLPQATEDEGLLEWLNRLMPPDTQLTGRFEGDWIQVINRGLPVPRTFLSDGAQSYLSWILDLAFRLVVAASPEKPSDVPATVLVDEIDQRMHPSWQQRLLRQLSDGLPNVQFICSAHSPLLAGGLRPQNLSVLEPDPDAPGDGAMTARALQEDLYGRTADGVLTSSYFELPNTRGQSFGNALRGLSEEAARSDQAALEFTRLLAAGGRGDAWERSEILERRERFRQRRP